MGRRGKFDKKGKGGPGQAPWRPRRRWRFISAVVAVLLLLGGGVGAWRWNAARAAPEPAPRFNLWGSSGRSYTLDDFAGKQEVVLIFYMGAT